MIKHKEKDTNMDKTKNDKKENQLSKQALERARKLFILEGISFALMFSFDQYISSYALILGITGVSMSYLFSFPRLFSSFAQIFSSYIVRIFKSEKKAMQFMIILNSLTWILLILCRYIQRTSILIIIVTLYYTFNAIIGNIWANWIIKYLDERTKAEYFGKRSSLMNLVILISLIISSSLITFAKKYSILGKNTEFRVYSIFFTIAFISRLSSYFIIKNIDEPKDNRKEINLKHLLFAKEHINPIIKNYLFLTGFFIFSVFISAPYFTEYMLRIQKWSYLQFVSFSILSVTIKILFSKELGKLADKFGHAKLFKIGLVISSIFIFPWGLINNYFIIFFFEMYNSIGWAIWDLMTLTLIYELSKPNNRATIISWFNLTIGVSAFLGSLISSTIFKTYQASFKDPYKAIFLTSGILRLTTIIIFARKLKDVRKFCNISNKDLIRYLFRILPREGIRSFVVQIRKIAKKQTNTQS